MKEVHVERCRMNESSGVDYLDVYEEGELVDGMEGVGQVSTFCELRSKKVIFSYKYRFLE